MRKLRVFDGSSLPRAVRLYLSNLTCYPLYPTLLNGFAKELSDSRDQSDNPYKIIGTQIIEIRPLSHVLNEHLPAGCPIDFMSVDVEGLDLDVLRSNNWTHYRPRYVLAEILDSSLHEIENHEVAKFMASVGYRIYAKCVFTVIFMDKEA